MLQGKWLLKHRFVHETEKKLFFFLRTHHKTEQKEVATPGIEFVQIKKQKKQHKALFIYRSGDPVKKLVMISSIPPGTKPIRL